MPSTQRPPIEAQRFVALLRGVNVGKANRVPMAQWRDLLAGLGCTDVATLLNSGNAVFTARGAKAAALAGAIEQALAESLGVSVPVIVKSRGEIDAIVAGNPLASTADDASRLLVAFAADAKTLALLASLVAPLVQPPEAVAIGRDAAYLWCPDGVLESRAASALLGKPGRPFTTRNWATVLKLQVLLTGP